MNCFREIVLIILYILTAPSDERSHGVNDLAKKVVGGSFTIQYQWPWQADILRNGLHHCGGTLIYDQWVLTAAHCLTEDKSVYTVRLGEVLKNHLCLPNLLNFFF